MNLSAKDLVVGKCYKVGNFPPFILLRKINKMNDIWLKIYSDNCIHQVWFGHVKVFKELK